MSYGPYPIDSGATLQAGLAASIMQPAPSGGRLMRGVVVATYVTDDPQNPYNNQQTTPYAVYCDVLCYGAGAGGSPTLIPSALVSQDRAGIQSGDIWHPQAASRDVSGGSLSLAHSNVMDLDGDHVLVGFIDDLLTQPVILRSLPHPQGDVGQAAAEPADGQRVRLRLVDGSPSLRKHHGSVYGITDTGDVLMRTTYANKGELTALGAPPVPPASGDVGNLLIQLHSRAQRLTQLIDMDTPASPKDVLRETLEATLWQLEFLQASAHLWVKDAGGNTLEAKGSGAAATLTVGSGQAHVALAEHLMALYTQLKAQFDNHLHGTSLGPSSTATASGFVAPAWDARIVSKHVAIPDEV